MGHNGCHNHTCVTSMLTIDLTSEQSSLGKA